MKGAKRVTSFVKHLFHREKTNEYHLRPDPRLPANTVVQQAGALTKRDGSVSNPVAVSPEVSYIPVGHLG
jgi:hypothetical protein